MTLPLDRTEIESLLQAWSGGDMSARDQRFPIVYPELKRMASRQLRLESSGQTLNTTALVHEACLGLLATDQPEWRYRAQFFAFMSTVMRHVLVDHARRRRAHKREGERVRVELPAEMAGQWADPLALLDLEAALARLTAHAPRMARVAECRLFAGMTDGEIAQALAMSERTVAREWQRGKAWLRVALEGDDVQGADIS